MKHLIMFFTITIVLVSTTADAKIKAIFSTVNENEAATAAKVFEKFINQAFLKQAILPLDMFSNRETCQKTNQWLSNLDFREADNLRLLIKKITQDTLNVTITRHGDATRVTFLNGNLLVKNGGVVDFYFATDRPFFSKSEVIEIVKYKLKNGRRRYFDPEAEEKYLQKIALQGGIKEMIVINYQKRSDGFISVTFYVLFGNEKIDHLSVLTDSAGSIWTLD